MLHANNCNQIVSGMVAVMYDAAGGPASGTASRLCLPDPRQDISVFRKEIVGWLLQHKEVQDFTIPEAIMPIAMGVYRCR